MRSRGEDFILIVERSAASCDRVFRKILPLSPLEHAAFDFIYNKLQMDEAEMGIPIRYIYLDLPAEQCLARIQSRARPEERAIELDYLVQLELKYTDIKEQAVVINGSLGK